MIRLTQTVQKGGCAAKVAATELREILAQVHFPPKDPSILIDGSGFDDAAVQILNSEIALVHTLDFFTPILDTPRLFGRVAAANALSDVYAMGGMPKTAMAILAFPTATFSQHIVAEVMQGACDVLREAGVSLVGGHSIDDDTLKFGLAVTGFVHPQRVWSNRGALVGDKLILTKALGTGTLTAALKRSAVTEEQICEAIEGMGTLNSVSAKLSADLLPHIHACTDITGFGLLGHAKHIAEASQVSLHIHTRELPILPLAIEMLTERFLTKAHRTNEEYADGITRGLATLEEAIRLLLFDPQTSGGLLLSVAPDQVDQIQAQLLPHFPFSKIIGEVVSLRAPKRISSGSSDGTTNFKPDSTNDFTTDIASGLASCLAIDQPYLFVT